MEAPNEPLSLFGHTPFHPPAHDALQVLLLVPFRDGDVPPARLQLAFQHAPVRQAFRHGERQLEGGYAPRWLEQTANIFSERIN